MFADRCPPLGACRRREAASSSFWDIPLERVGEFVAKIPAPLGMGTLQWRDGRWGKGFICEPCALTGARDMTVYSGWRRYIDEREREE